MTTTTTTTYRYEITISGKGGDFWFLPMTPDQVAYWKDKGNEALSEHLNGGCGEDGTPAGFELGHYLDLEDQAGGFEEGELIVQNEDGETCFENDSSDIDWDHSMEIERVVDAPQAGGFFRTYEKMEWTFSLELPEQFDDRKLRMRATRTPNGYLINGLIYAGREIPPSMEVEKEWAKLGAELLSERLHGDVRN